MVAAPCRAPVYAARWNGSPPQTTTGAASVSESHCQLSNCRAGTMASSTTGTASSTEVRSRCRRAASSVSGPADPGPSAPPGSVAGADGSGGGGTFSSAVYPVFTTVAIRSPTATPGG